MRQRKLRAGTDTDTRVPPQRGGQETFFLDCKFCGTLNYPKENGELLEGNAGHGPILRKANVILLASED